MLAEPTSTDSTVDLNLLFGTVRDRNAPPAVADDVAHVVSGTNAFALDLYGRVVTDHASRNVVIGPYSISTALGMVYAGAAGITREEISEVLRADLPDDRWHVALNTIDTQMAADTVGAPGEWASGNKIWVASGVGLRPEFLDTVTGLYGSPVAQADFAADPEARRSEINGWVSEQTALRIPEMFPPDSITSATVLTLANAVALDAPWATPFDPDSPRTGRFTESMA